MAKRKQPGVPPASQGAEAAAFWEEYVRQANEMLALMRGENARWWIYSVSMRTFELVIGEPTGKGGNVVLSATGCQAIAGPTNWTMQALVVIYLGPEMALCYDIHDDSAGFRLIAESFRWNLDIDILNRVEEIGFR